MIRLALPSDWPRLREILEENALTIDGVAYDSFSPPCLVYVRDGEVVGFMQAHLGSPYAVITEGALARAHQNKGYGYRLLQHMETLLRASGVLAWVTYTGEKNPTAGLLERYGARGTGYGTAWVKGLA